MTKKQLFEQSFKSPKEATRPLFWPILMHFAAKHGNTDYAAFASDYRSLVEANLIMLDRFDMDMISLISDPYRETQAFGARISFPRDTVPICHGPVIKSSEDVRSLRIPDVYRAERTLDRIRGAEEFSRRLQGNVPVMGWIEGPLAEACDLAGVSEMLVYLMTDPDMCNILLDKCMKTGMDFARAQVEAGCDLIGIGDAICSQIDRETYNEFVKQRHAEIVSFIHGLGARVKLHICGDITHHLPSLNELGVDILDLDWQVDMDLAYRITGDSCIRAGNIDPVWIRDHNAEQVFERTRELVQSEKGRRFKLSAGCEITGDTPPENLLAMRRALDN
jgi:MtaA/CmuA family methyltransferase